MHLYRHFFIVTFTLILTACLGDSDSSDDSDPRALDLVPSESPVEGITAVFYQDVAYDEYERTKFDIFLPDDILPTALIIFVHGGGYIGGDKSSVYNSENRIAELQETLNNSVAYATVNYQLLDAVGVETEGVIKSLEDVKRAVQFIRYYADSFNIDTNNIALYGSSGGASASLWLATHDDMADPDNTDPVLKESTRISAAGAIETQATLDLFRWETDVFPEYGFSLQVITEASPELRDYMWLFYGLDDDDTFAEFSTDENIAYRENIDFLSLMSSDDPSIFIKNDNQPEVEPTTSQNVMFHHPYHARELKEQAELVGIEEITYIQALEVEDASGEELIPFLLRQFD